MSINAPTAASLAHVVIAEQDNSTSTNDAAVRLQNAPEPDKNHQVGDTSDNRLQERRERFAARVEGRRERLAERADKAQRNASRLYQSARGMASVIPFGQPILVGHHSEGRDRRYRAKIHKTFGAAFQEGDKAESLARRADAVGSGGISSDDPDALAKLRAELASAEAAHARMKRINKHLKAENRAALLAEGLSDDGIAALQKGNPGGQTGFPPYTLTNSNQRMNRLKGRIQALERAEALRRQAGGVPQREWAFVDGGGLMVEDFDANRVYLHFDRKPEKVERERLVRAGFRWTPSVMAWGRQLHRQSLWIARSVLAELGHQLPAEAPGGPGGTDQA